MSQTPNFDAALDKILADLKPHTRVCSETGESFAITERDIEMYKLLRVPPPTTVWWARIRQKRHFMGGFDLYRRALPDGCSVVSMYDPESFAPILPPTEWHGDDFDALRFAQAAEPEKSFFEQWLTLSRAVPRPAIIQDPKSENSDWSLHNWSMKDCYYTYEGGWDEDIHYADLTAWSKHDADLNSCVHSEWCYESVLLANCSRVFFSEECKDCIEVSFCLGCLGCSDCFGCTNLRKKKFCFLNEQLTEEEYKKRLAEIDLSDSRVVEEWRGRITDRLWQPVFRLGQVINHSENCAGDDIHDSRDVHGIMIYESERLRNCFGCTRCKEMLDMTSCLQSERSANVLKVFDSYEVKNSLHCSNCLDVDYSELLSNCEHCFGCLGLRHKKFCVFNKQYAEEEYWPLVDALKTAMLERGEYGEFFPYRLSPFAYNASGVSTMYEFNEAEARALGARWYQAPNATAEALPVEEIPNRLADVSDEILKKQFRCPESGRAFAFVKPELALHRAVGLALPRLHPTVRRLRRAAQYRPPILYSHKCDSCGKIIDTRLPPAHTAPVVCQPCYEEIVIGEKAAPVAVVPPLIARGG